MKIAAGKADGFVAAPPDKISYVLIFGPDRGLVGERVRTLAAAIAGDLKDPFRAAELGAGDIKSDPARLADEANALAMTGGRRVVRVRGAGDDLAAIFSSLMDGPAPAAMVIVEGGELAARSKLRKLFEGADNAAALACYGDREDALARVIRNCLKSGGLAADGEAMAYLVGHLGADRAVTRRELEKLALYMGGPGTVTVADAIAAIGDSAAISVDEVIYAAAGGDRAGLDEHLARCLEEGAAPVAVLRAAGRHFMRLHLAAGRVAAGDNPALAMKVLRPAVIYLFADRFRRQLSQWSPQRLGEALELVLEAEIACKQTAMPSAAICGRALMRISQAARR